MTERTIFLDALEIADPAQRSAYLDRACGGDATLRHQVEALLAAHQREGPFLDVPAVEQVAAALRQPASQTEALAPLSPGDQAAAPNPAPEGPAETRAELAPKMEALASDRDGNLRADATQPEPRETTRGNRV